MLLSNGERLNPYLLIIDHCTSDNKKLVVHPHVWTHNEFFYLYSPVVARF